MRTKNTEKSEHRSLARIPELIMKRILKNRSQAEQTGKNGSFISHKEITVYVTETCTSAGEIRYNSPPQSRTKQEQGTTS